MLGVWGSRVVFRVGLGFGFMDGVDVLEYMLGLGFRIGWRF